MPRIVPASVWFQHLPAAPLLLRWRSRSPAVSQRHELGHPSISSWRPSRCSCGERCDRPAPGCAHPCMLLCHPGPCPPCPRAVSASCYCGALVTNKRCGRQEFSCGGTCGAPLPCGHTCPLVCHDGDCPPCNLASSVACRCGAEAAQLPCSQQGVYQVRHALGRLSYSIAASNGCYIVPRGRQGLLVSLPFLSAATCQFLNASCCLPRAP